MKKVIITIMAITTMMSITGCHKEEPNPAADGTVLGGTITHETIEVETIETEMIVDSEGYVLDVDPDEFYQLQKLYLEGKISEEYYQEYLYNSRVNCYLG